MQRLSIQRGHAFILIYAINDKKSLPQLKPIYDEIIDIKGGIEMVPLMLVGNKCDDTNRQVPESEGMRMAKQWNCSFLETSAKNNFNVQELFEQLLHLEKRRTMSLETGNKKNKEKSKAAKRADGFKNKCDLMWLKQDRHYSNNRFQAFKFVNMAGQTRPCLAFPVDFNILNCE